MGARSSQSKHKSSLKPKTINSKLERARDELFGVFGQQIADNNPINVSHSAGKPISLTVSVPGHHASGLGELLNRKLEEKRFPARVNLEAIREEGKTTYSLAFVPQDTYPDLDTTSARRFAKFFVDPEEAISLSNSQLVHYDAAERTLTALPGILKDIRQRKEYHPIHGVQV